MRRLTFHGLKIKMCAVGGVRVSIRHQNLIWYGNMHCELEILSEGWQRQKTTHTYKHLRRLQRQRQFWLFYQLYYLENSSGEKAPEYSLFFKMINSWGEGDSPGRGQCSEQQTKTKFRRRIIRALFLVWVWGRSPVFPKSTLKAGLQWRRLEAWTKLLFSGFTNLQFNTLVHYEMSDSVGFGRFSCAIAK